MAEERQAQAVFTRFFVFSGPNSSTRVHFMPAVSASTAPTDLLCGFTIFGRGIESKRVVLDGAKAGQPDGIRLEDALPVLRSESSAGVVGVELEFTSDHPRLNLLNSCVAVELTGPQISLLYYAQAFNLSRKKNQSAENQSVENPSGQAAFEILLKGRMRPQVSLVIGDRSISTSLIIVNGALNELRPEISRSSAKGLRPLQVGTLISKSVLEVPLDELVLKESPDQRVGLESLRAEALFMPEEMHPDVSYYTLYRDANTKKPLTAIAL